MKEVLRGLALLVLGLMVVGFGLCGIAGVVIGVLDLGNGEGYSPVLFTYGGLGVLVAAVAYWPFRRLMRNPEQF